MDVQGIFRWNGFAADGACSMTRAAGVQPGIVSMRFILAAPIDQFGTLVISYGSEFIRLSDCRVVRSVIPPGAGKMREVVVQDRRWGWEYPVVFGAFNVQNGKRYTLRQMVQDCFDALGEVGVDLSLVPEITPPTEWAGVPAASALQSLLDSVGLQLVLGLDDRTRLVRIGEGIAPPFNDRRVSESTYTAEPPVVPEWLCVQGAPIRFQRDLRLEPVGYERFDADAYAWPIDELSYKPANGWENEDPDGFMGVDAKYRDLARATIWKTFRIVEDDQELPGKSQFSKSQKAWEQAAQGSGQAALQYVDKVFRLDDRTRILPLDSAQVGLDFFSDKWRPDRKPAQVLGYFYDRKQGAKNSGTKPASIPDNARHFGTTSNVEATTPELIYGGGYDDPNNRGNKDGRRFSLDVQTGIVKFDEPVIYLNRDANGVASRAAPLLFLRTSFVIRDIEKRQPLKQQYWYRLPNGVPGLVKTIDAPALEYEFALTEAGESKTDYAEFEREALYYCEKELRRYVANEAATIPMRGFVFNYDVDGAIRSVQLSKSERGECTTQLEWQTERPEDRTTYEEKMKMVEQVQLVQMVRKFIIDDMQKKRGR
jgi:hypothetical protein